VDNDFDFLVTGHRPDDDAWTTRRHRGVQRVQRKIQHDLLKLNRIPITVGRFGRATR
jgi:hypothetical protein